MDRDRELERLREAMEQAKALYEGAKLEYERAKERRDDLGSTHPDGSLQYATLVRTHAFRTYRNALSQYNRFILDRMPLIGIDRATTHDST
jgi:hypothetical protein